MYRFFIVMLFNGVFFLLKWLFLLFLKLIELGGMLVLEINLFRLLKFLFGKFIVFEL